jgi:glutathione S-transferase
MDHELVVDLPWKRKNAFSENHVFSDLPALQEIDGTILEGWYAIVEHLELHYRSTSLLRVTQKERAETRRIVTLFNEMFFADVTKNVVFEKVMNKYIANASPDSSCIRKGNAAMGKYLDYVSWLMDRRNWLAGDEFTLADICAAAQISCVDYVGSMEWERHPNVKEWYMRVKSRPSFRGILADRISNIIPPAHYSELDF